MADACDGPRLDARKIAGERKCFDIRDQPVITARQQERRAIEAGQIGGDRLRKQGGAARLLSLVAARAAEDLDQLGLVRRYAGGKKNSEIFDALAMVSARQEASLRNTSALTSSGLLLTFQVLLRIRRSMRSG